MNPIMTTLNQIESILEKEIRPALRAHGGNIRIQRYQDGILTVKLLGQCSECPSAMETAESLVGAVVMQALPDVKQVILDDSVDQELLDFARKLLNHEAS